MTIDSPTPPPLSLLLFPEPTVVLTVVPGPTVVLTVTVNTKNIVQPLTFGCSIFFQTQKHVCFSVFGPASVFFRGGRFFFPRRALYY